MNFYFSNQLLKATKLFVETTLPRIEIANSLRQTAVEIGVKTKELTSAEGREDLTVIFIQLTSQLDNLESLTAKISQQESEMDILALNWMSQAIRSQAQLVFQMEAQLVQLIKKIEEKRKQISFELVGVRTLGHEVSVPAIKIHDEMHLYIKALLSELNTLDSSESLADVDEVELALQESREVYTKKLEQGEDYSTEQVSVHEIENILYNINHLLTLKRQYFLISNNIGLFIEDLSDLVNQLTQQANTYVSVVFSHFQVSARKVIEREEQSLFLTFVLLICSVFLLYILYRRIVIRGFGDKLSLISRAMGADPGSEDVVHLPIQGRDEIADMARAAEELLKKSRRLNELATIDGLTKVCNRRRFFDLAEQEVNRVMRDKTKAVVLMLDIDHFKLINDTYGHAFGDKVLYEVAQACQQIVRTIDIFARYGGEEFVVLMPKTDMKKGMIVAERIREKISGMRLEADDGTIVKTTVSIGLTETSLDETNVDQALKDADNALYRAKRNGRNRVEISEDSESLSHPAA